jgi:carboxyvinyl-carboxyphosphonate phosphorylmutase
MTNGGDEDMNWTDRRRRFRAILKAGRCYHPASVFDPLSARIAQDLGFEVGMFAGSTASLTVLGAPDLIVLTLSEFAEQAYRINRAFDVPLLVDADHGYGNALNVMRTVQELESAGVSALTIEDTLLPRPFGPGGGLTSIEEGVGKMRAALAARQDPDLVIVGRTIAMGSTSTEDALARAKAYAAAGVDAFFFVGIKDRAQLEAAAAAIDIPIIIGGGSPELSDLDYLATKRVRVALQGHQPIMAAAQAVHATMKALREGVQPKDLQGVPSADFMAKATRDADYKGWTKEFLGG